MTTITSTRDGTRVSVSLSLSLGETHSGKVVLRADPQRANPLATLVLGCRRHSVDCVVTLGGLAGVACRRLARFHFLASKRKQLETELLRTIVVDLAHAHVDQRDDPARIVHFLDEQRQLNRTEPCSHFTVRDS